MPMGVRAMQCKDIPDEPILRLLAASPGQWHCIGDGYGHMPSVSPGMPSGIPDKLALAKMNMLLRRGLVDGCGCGCRGDWEITAKGLDWLARRS